MGLFIDLERYMAPYEDGYVYFPSAKSGGKFISRAEFEQLDADYRAMGRQFWAKSIGFWVALILVCGAIIGLHGPSWAASMVPVILIAAWAAWFLRPSLAPWLLVRKRPAILPPRGYRASQRVARDRYSWVRLGAISMLFLAMFVRVLLNEPDSLWRTFLLVIYGATVALQAWVAFEKLRDARRGPATSA